MTLSASKLMLANGRVEQPRRMYTYCCVSNFIDAWNMCMILCIVYQAPHVSIVIIVVVVALILFDLFRFRFFYHYVTQTNFCQFVKRMHFMIGFISIFDCLNSFKSIPFQLANARTYPLWSTLSYETMKCEWIPSELLFALIEWV